MGVIFFKNQTELAFIYDKYHYLLMEPGFKLRFFEIRRVSGATVIQTTVYSAE